MTAAVVRRVDVAGPGVGIPVIRLFTPFRSLEVVPRALLGMAFGSVEVLRRGTDGAKLPAEGLFPVSGPGG